MEWIALAQDRQVAGSRVCGKKNLGFHKMLGIS